MDNNNVRRPVTKPIKGQPDGKNDLRVIWSAYEKTILSDRRKKD
jgi:hypothetical protein